MYAGCYIKEMRRAREDDDNDHDANTNGRRRVAARVTRDEPLSNNLMDMPNESLVKMLKDLSDTDLSFARNANQHLRMLVDSSPEIWATMQQRYFGQQLLPYSQDSFNALIDQLLATPAAAFLQRMRDDITYATGAPHVPTTRVKLRIEIGMHHSHHVSQSFVGGNAAGGFTLTSFRELTEDSDVHFSNHFPPDIREIIAGGGILRNSRDWLLAYFKGYGCNTTVSVRVYHEQVLCTSRMFGTETGRQVSEI